MSEHLTVNSEQEETVPTHFVFTCNDGSAYEFPTGHPDITIGGFRGNDNGNSDAGFSFEFVMQYSSLMPTHLQQFYIAGSRIETAAAEPEPKKKRKKNKARKTLAKIHEAIYSEASVYDKVSYVDKLLRKHYS